MTQTIVIKTEVNVENIRKTVPIKFNEFLSSEGEFLDTHDEPHEYNFVELICLDYSDKLDRLSKDLMFAYHNPENRGAGTLFLGCWNDGVV